MSVVDYDDGDGEETLRLRHNTENRSALPPIEEVREMSTMKIITVDVSVHPQLKVETNLLLTNPTKQTRPVIASVYRLDDERIKGFMPSKVWLANDETLRVLFYVNTSLPQTVRPFKDNTYLMSFMPSYGDVIEYDVSMRIFIDQIMTKAGMSFVTMFGDETYIQIIAKELEDEWTTINNR